MEYKVLYVVYSMGEDWAHQLTVLINSWTDSDSGWELRALEVNEARVNDYASAAQVAASIVLQRKKGNN